MRFLVDRCVGRRTVEWLRAEGHDAVAAADLGSDPGDRELLRRASEERRILITMDKDFGAFVFSEKLSHAGIIRLPDIPVAERLPLLSTVLIAHGGELAKAAIVTVRGGRIRISQA